MLQWVKVTIQKYKEVISYLFFGALTTVVNIATYFVCATLCGMNTFWSTTVAWILSVVFAYFTNRKWVFVSKTVGTEAVREFAMFIFCRLVTYFTDVIFMMAAVDWYGSHYIPEKWSDLWGLGAKVVSNLVVVILNYIFSKLFIFKKPIMNHAEQEEA